MTKTSPNTSNMQKGTKSMVCKIQNFVDMLLNKKEKHRSIQTTEIGDVHYH